jgi:hypothetical protein
MRRQNKQWGNFFHSESAKTDWRDHRTLNSGQQRREQQSKQIESSKQEDYEEEQTGQDASSKMYCDFEDRRQIRGTMHEQREGGQRQVRDAPHVGRAAAALYRRHKSGDAVHAQCRERSSPDMRQAPRHSAHD